MQRKLTVNAVEKKRRIFRPAVGSVGSHVARGIAVALILCPFAVGASDVFAGRAIYDKHCVQCHGPDGTPSLPGVPNFAIGESLQRSEGDLFTAVKAGRNLMPGYDRVIREQEILDVIAYIRTLWR